MENKNNNDKLFIDENSMDIDEPTKQEIIKKHTPFYIFISILIFIAIVLAITVAILAS